MATFEKKNPRFEAFQFKGSNETAIEIIQNVQNLAPTWTVRYFPSSTEFRVENGQLVEKTIPVRLTVLSSLGNEFNVVNNDWVVIDRDGSVEIHNTARFNELFQSI